ncbi:hypothetical protein NDU88_004448 [Pleurodeles waltl]|uniref:Uncharacterized protein n=1 Tax=Pleurodeles waltl TaxID=8319 RepID=A0AAV7LI31_PLEWA|nr:hypothetical protein NDU88_004448 [Pleurodeles waltl]
MPPQFLKPASRVPGRPVGSAVRSAFGTRLFSSPGHEQSWTQEAAAPGESAIGAAAPPTLRHSRVSAPPCTRTKGRSRHNVGLPRDSDALAKNAQWYYIRLLEATSYESQSRLAWGYG